MVRNIQTNNKHTKLKVLDIRYYKLYYLIFKYVSILYFIRYITEVCGVT